MRQTSILSCTRDWLGGTEDFAQAASTQGYVVVLHAEA